MTKESTLIGDNDQVDPIPISMTIGFLRTYADRHHDKEEEIFFRDLKKKRLAGGA